MMVPGDLAALHGLFHTHCVAARYNPDGDFFFFFLWSSSGVPEDH